jgi:hypothetical protein
MSMKRFLGLAAMAAVLALSSVPAYADATKSVDVSAKVDPYCVITAGGTGNLTAKVPIDTAGTVDTAYLDLVGPSVTCNAPYNVQVSSQFGGIKRGGDDVLPGGFSDVIDYTGIATFGSVESILDTSDGTGANGEEHNIPVVSTGGAKDTLGISIRPKLAADTAPLAAGTYSDTLKVTIAPN